MQPRAAKRPGVIQGAHDAVAKFLLAAGVAGHAALALRPIARRRIEQHLLQPIILEPGRNLGRRVVVRKKELNPLKARLRRQREAVQEGDFIEHHG